MISLVLGTAGLAFFGLLAMMAAIVRRSARDEVLQEIKKKEVEVAKKQAVVMAEHRTVADTSSRLHNGSF